MKFIILKIKLYLFKFIIKINYRTLIFSFFEIGLFLTTTLILDSSIMYLIIIVLKFKRKYNNNFLLIFLK